MHTIPSWVNLTPAQSREHWLDYIVKTHKCTRKQAEDAFDQSNTPREAETLIKIAMASAAVKKYTITLPSLPFIDIDDILAHEDIEKSIKKESWRRFEPECTCDTKLLFDQGCKCEYAEWKKENK